jgi:hypothetical protein
LWWTAIAAVVAASERDADNGVVGCGQRADEAARRHVVVPRSVRRRAIIRMSGASQATGAEPGTGACCASRTSTRRSATDPEPASAGAGVSAKRRRLRIATAIGPSRDQASASSASIRRGGVPNQVPNSANLTPPNPRWPHQVWLYKAKSGLPEASRNDGVRGSSPRVGLGDAHRFDTQPSPPGSPLAACSWPRRSSFGPSASPAKLFPWQPALSRLRLHRSRQRSSRRARRLASRFRRSAAACSAPRSSQIRRGTAAIAEPRP